MSKQDLKDALASKQGQRLTRKFQSLLHRCDALKRKRARLDREKAAFSDFRAGRITKTELRHRVPRSWITNA